MLGSTNAWLSDRLVEMVVQVVPPSTEYCQTPWVAPLDALPVMAIPASVLALEPPATWSVLSENTGVINDVTVLPCVAIVTLPVTVGASLTGETVVVSGTVAALIGVMPPLLETSDETEKVTGPLELSISRTVSPPGVPFQLAARWKESLAVLGSRIAVVSPRPEVGMVFQVVPPSSE